MMLYIIIDLITLRQSYLTMVKAGRGFQRGGTKRMQCVWLWTTPNLIMVLSHMQVG